MTMPPRGISGGDHVENRESGERGRVIEVLTVSAGWQGTYGERQDRPMAWTQWEGGKKSAVPVSDLIKRPQR